MGEALNPLATAEVRAEVAVPVGTSQFTSCAAWWWDARNTGSVMARSVPGVARREMGFMAVGFGLVILPCAGLVPPWVEIGKCRLTRICEDQRVNPGGSVVADQQGSV